MPNDAACTLVAERPTTFAGVIALLAYVNYADTDGEGWPDSLYADDTCTKTRSWHYFLVQNSRGSPAGYRGGGVMDQINLEASINDVTNMAEISGLLTVQLADTLHEAAKAGVSGKQAIEAHQWLVDLVSFAAWRRRSRPKRYVISSMPGRKRRLEVVAGPPVDAGGYWMGLRTPLQGSGHRSGQSDQIVLNDLRR